MAQSQAEVFFAFWNLLSLAADEIQFIQFWSGHSNPESRPKREQRQQWQDELVTVELDDTSALRALPGETAQVRLRFINQRSVAVALYLTVADTHNFITAGVRRVYVGQQDVETLSITVTIPGDTPLRTLDLITISSAETQNFRAINATVYFYVTEEVVDTTQPSVSHRITKNCDGALEPTTCSYRNWTFEATVKDDSSGIRKITTQPVQLQTSDHLVMGIRGTITYQYSVSCCINEVEILVTDVAGNFVRYKINVSGFTLGIGEIIAIVLAVIIIILLIVLIIVCVHQKKKSHSFPMSRD
ncbi:uncharacterized protein LOC126187709 isoform X1 [Schistocerca cancellata]|uniref:uncharacterized protein LOC126187709 isoform X1 n=1 Tax=Schistocerca cancellata TaxID=274614 RepID=UPI00211976B0|nr:uncharacterized protein LOC126187709 isoform X1 [Schistocerca cancellata]